MGGSSYSHDAYSARAAFRVASATPVFKHDSDVRTGKAAAAVHANLNPYNVKLRESRDSEEHATTIPIGILLDTTGSMAEVPKIIEARLPRLMGSFLDDKASGKRYLGDGYPAILIGAVDDYDAQIRCGYSPSASGCLQVGQFESGIEIDNDLERLWLTGHGGGTYEESYQLGIYFFARHTAHDHFEKRGRKGYLFIIGDEHAYGTVAASEVKDVIGDTIQADIPLASILAEAGRLYHTFFILPNLTQHYGDGNLRAYWMKLIGQQNVILLDDPEKVCEAIVSAVALCERHVGIADLVGDGVASGIENALVPLSASTAVARFSADALPVIDGEGGEIDRL